jgi:hypothetical protein
MTSTQIGDKFWLVDDGAPIREVKHLWKADSGYEIGDGIVTKLEDIQRAGRLVRVVSIDGRSRIGEPEAVQLEIDIAAKLPIKFSVSSDTVSLLTTYDFDAKIDPIEPPSVTLK